MSNQNIAKWSISGKIWSTYLFVESPFSYSYFILLFFPRSNSCQRRPLSELSPNALSPPIAIPRISINYHGTTTNFEETNNDDVFDISSSNKENFQYSNHLQSHTGRGIISEMYM